MNQMRSDDRMGPTDMGARIESGEPVALHRAGRAAMAQGDYASAVELLRRAADLAPHWPEVTYDEATAHVLAGNLTGAVRAYESTNSRFPDGFFETHSRLDAVRRERRGDVPDGTARRLLDLEWVRQWDERRAYLRELVVDAPNLPQAWLELSKLEQHRVPRQEAIAQGLRANPDPGTRGQLEVEAALAEHEAGHTAQAVATLQALLHRGDCAVGTVERARLLLTQWAPVPLDVLPS